MSYRSLCMCSMLLLAAVPLSAAASTINTSPLEFSGWMPYWRSATSTADVLPHLSQLTEVNPFGYTVKNNGTLYDALTIGSPPWSTFIRAAQATHVLVVPTVMWSDGSAIQRVLSNPQLRGIHERAIIAMVKANGFDGVDIDYEGKYADTKDYFSTFLKELSLGLGGKRLDCTIEARTPPDSAFAKPPAQLDYANDYTAINKYCTRVRLMTYDQESIDLLLNKAAANANQIYAPLSDPAWVEKVANLAAQTISKNKLVIGAATYGYEYDVTATPDGSFHYKLLWSFNPRYATDLAKTVNITPSRNSAGEMSFSYLATSTPASIAKAIMKTKPPSYPPTSSGDNVGARALAYAEKTGTAVDFHLMWWSDASAIADKVALAYKLGVRGVAVFKFDGGEDQGMWSILK